MTYSSIIRKLDNHFIRWSFVKMNISIYFLYHKSRIHFFLWTSVWLTQSASHLLLRCFCTKQYVAWTPIYRYTNYELWIFGEKRDRISLVSVAIKVGITYSLIFCSFHLIFSLFKKKILLILSPFSQSFETSPS